MSSEDKALAEAVAAAMRREDQAAAHAGIEVDEVGPGQALARMVVKATMINSHAVCHGGYVFLLADVAFAYACNSRNLSNVAAGCHIDFLKAAVLGDQLEAQAVERQRGRRGGLYDIEVTNQNKQLIAVVRGRSAALNKPVIEE